MPFYAPSRSLRMFLLIVDVQFIVYWVASALHLVPAEWLYAHHDDPVMVAWNWSFLPLDFLVSASGLGALVVARNQDARWPLLALMSLALTSASGLNAVAFWALRGDFDLTWWTPNVLLLLCPWLFMRSLWQQQDGLPERMARRASPGATC
ncbi:MAG: hypothetical protein JWN48_5480 [Myxococcaceae bacterium]|nr:hypothetical protein [Myxococcaceae bacterium]